MTAVKERMMACVQELTDEDSLFVLRIMENLSHKSDGDLLNRRRQARAELQQFRGRLKADFDYKKELSDWREERYGRAD